MKPTDAHKKGEWGVEPWIHLGTIGEFCQPWLFVGCWNFAGLLLKGQETPKLKRKMMDGFVYFKKGGTFFFKYINQHY